ncbi:type III-A CRISPR-associated RAMP protein Csm4 [Marinitoga litoralis]|uniref:type III-A CRISPR-associated RAMP protein Csm4 n=1 Tax=Marinitoga litoralis TaxID=570855 RepID=UPI00195F6811|nr:type III-A CRISPR-associated RAMP protein Csm4 [Marinitoga litoralis]MBM7558353.1 CRISPR type III-A-associated RAMP protein Csm4 [Marinitoga litoralis]
MGVYIVELNFRTFIHKTSHKDDETSELPNSNTILGMLGNSLNKIKSDDDTYEFINSIRLSSLFPKMEKEYLIPKPFKLPEKIEADNFKKIKKASYISLSNLQKWINKPEIVDEFKLVKNVLPGVAIDRIENSTSLYLVSSLCVKDSFYFLIEIPENQKDNLEIALRISEDEGLGGYRKTRGFGAFDFEIKEIKNTLFEKYLYSDKYNYVLNLGMYIPTKEEIHKITDKSYYKIKEYRSFDTRSGDLKPTVKYFEEGSLFDFEINGKNIKTTINNSIISGTPIYLKVNWSDVNV